MRPGSIEVVDATVPRAATGPPKAVWPRDDGCAEGIKEAVTGPQTVAATALKPEKKVPANPRRGLWAPLRGWLGSFHGVSKKYLQDYVATFE